MVITIRQPDGKNLTIPIPSFMVSGTVKKYLKGKDYGISPDEVIKIINLLQKHKKTHGKFTLVEVDAADGTQVTITV